MFKDTEQLTLELRESIRRFNSRAEVEIAKDKAKDEKEYRKDDRVQER